MQNTKNSISNVFEQNYAELYDIVYAAKNYTEETLRIIDILHQRNKSKTKFSFLDIGCGTGKHALEFAKLGHHVVCMDQSDSMLSYARDRFEKAGQQGVFLHEDAENFHLNQKFDSVIMLFAVLNYFTTNESQSRLFQNIREHLTLGGLFIFDTWYGPAVKHLEPERRIKRFEIPDGYIERTSSGVLNSVKEIVTINIAMKQYVDDKVMHNIEETHIMRFFDIDDLNQRLIEHGLQLELIEDFDVIGKAPSLDSWSMLCAARAI